MYSTFSMIKIILFLKKNEKYIIFTTILISSKKTKALKKCIFLFIFLLTAFSNYAQKQANFWYFGEYAGLNFGMGVPIALTNGALNTGEGCSSISTAAGILQCYTDGTYVYDRNNDQMPHGNGLLGNYSSAQSGIIVPKPSSTTQYYIFTVDAYEDNLVDGLCYSRVDMTLNGGLGDVVTSEKNISLLPLTCEKVTAVGHSNGSTIWVITHQWGTDAFYAYQITTLGVDLNPVISHTGPPIMGNMQQAKGYLKVSPDGSKIAMANNTAFMIGIFNFNHSTGVVTHLVSDYNFTNPGGYDPGGPYGVEFSPNSSRLYISEWKANRKIYQYDVSSGIAQTILDSRVIVASVGQSADPIGALQLGPDNRMYIARQYSPYLSRINSPNTLGTGCGFVDNALNLAGRQSQYGLPPFIQSFFYLTADFYWDTPTCDGTPVHFYTSASDNPDSVRWNFGDVGSGPANTSVLLNPTHLYPSPGSYWVTLIVYLYGVAKNVFHIIVVSEPPEVYIGNDTTICNYEPFYLHAGSGFDSYLWQNGDTNQSILAETSGLYWCQVTGAGGCTDTDSLNLVINPVPEVSAGPDQTIANGTSIILEGSLTGGSGNFTYHWQPENMVLDPFVLQPSTVNMSFTTMFTLTVTDNQGGCTDLDQVLITVLGGPLSCNPFADPQAICIGEQSQLQAMPSGGSGNYLYSWTSNPPGFTSDLYDPVVAPLQTTTYTVTIDDGYSTVDGDVQVTVNQLPVPEAGPDKTIPFGTSTSLQGSASSGSGSYSYHWEPADKLINPYNPQPTTILLDETTLFTLTVTDVQTGCVCSEPDYMTVVITGNALNVNPMAQPDTICSGESVQLYSLAGGGSGIYEYYWTSVPAGYTSTEANPIVEPAVTTIYSVSITDGYTNVSGSATVVVNPTPIVALGPDATVCVFDTLTLDAGNPGSSYIWSNGSTDRVIKIATTGIGFDLRTINVTVTSPEGCVATDQRTIAFDFAACTGILDPIAESDFRIYPNPGNGIIHIENLTEIRNCQLFITDIFGREMIKNKEIRFTDTESTFNLNFESYPPGIYFIRISENGKDLISLKYLLNR
jgi:hypothetical protein